MSATCQPHALAASFYASGKPGAAGSPGSRQHTAWGRFRSRRRRLSWSGLCLLVVAVCGYSTPLANAQIANAETVANSSEDAALATLFPSSTVIYVELQPLNDWLDHPLRKQLLESEAFLKVWRSPEVVKARGGLTLAELALGDKLENIARKLTAGGVALAVDRRHEGAALVARAESASWLEDYMQRLLKLARGDNENATITERDYRGIRAYQLDKQIFAAVGEVLVVSEKGDFAKEIVDRLLDSDSAPSGNSGLVAAEFYQAAMALGNEMRDATERDANPQVIAVMAIDLPALRKAGVADNLLQGKADNFAGELILGGVLGVLHEVPFAYGQLALNAAGPRLSLATPYQHEWLGEQREHFVGPEGAGVASQPLQIDQSIAALSVYRNVSQLWLWAGDLFDERVNDELAQADTTLTTLFSGHDFGTEILAALYPELQIIVSQPDFESLPTPPAIQLPPFALVARLREPDFMRGELKRIFQSLVGLINVTGAMNGQPQLDLGNRQLGESIVYTAEYVRPIDARPDTPPPIQFNFSPSLAFVGDQAILASTIQQAEQLTAALQRVSSVSGDADPSGHESSVGSEQNPGKNTLVQLDAEGLRSILALNRDQLIAQNMLEKGHSRKEAEAEIDGLLSLVTLFDSAELTLGFQPHVELNVTIELK
jgi:hypothetical protein